MIGLIPNCRRAALLLAFVCAACGQSGSGSAPSAHGVAPAVTLSRGAVLAKDVEAFPRIDVPGGPLIARINMTLAASDGRVRSEIADCKASAGAAGSDWQREISVKMVGPAFLSLLDRNGYFCGGPHPDDATGYDTFDLAAGAPIDWRAYLPADLVGQPRIFEDFNGLPAAQLSAPALIAWYRETALAQLDAEMRADCAEAYAADDLHVEIYLDAKHAALAAETDSFPHVITACVETAYMDIAELRRRGAKPALTDALEVAHNAGHWAPD